MKISVLRLGHRFSRDARLSTHVALTARALGASEIIFDEKDSGVEASIAAVNKGWGGKFKVRSVKGWRKLVKDFKGEVIHLTMYGLPLHEVECKIRNKKNKLIIVGGAKVPAEVYQLADYNVAVGSQPHSEVAALALLLDRLQGGAELKKIFRGGKKIIPQERGKKVEA